MSFASAKHVMFFEVGHEGHVPSYTDALVTEAQRDVAPQRFSFVMSNRLYERLLPSTRQAFEQNSNINFISLSDEEVAACRKGNGFQQGPTRWRKANDIAERIGADHIFFYLLDSALYGALRAQHDGKKAFSGILFHPEMHLCLKRSPKSLKRFLSQALFYALTFPLPNLKRVWTLDPIFPEFASKWLPAGKKVKFLSEISITLPEATQPSKRSTDRVTFLLFGIMKRRKGVMNTLEALTNLPPGYQKKIRLVLAGAIDSDLCVALPEAIDRLAKQCPDIAIITHFEFLEEQMLTALINDCDVLLAPYVGHVGSSGVVYTAARAGKPLISTNESLLGEIVERYQLGLIVDPTVAHQIRNAFVHFSDRERISTHQKSTEAAEYLEMNMANFSESILRGN